LKKKILITPEGMYNIKDKVEEIFGSDFELDFSGGQINDKNILIEKLKDKDASVIGAEKIDEHIIKQCNNLKILSRFGEGYDSININDANKFNIKVAISNNVNAKPVARHTLSLLLCMTNKIIENYASTKNKEWKRHYNISPEGTTIGIIGMGHIGLEFANLASLIGYNISYFSRNKKFGDVYNGYKFINSIEELISSSDIISLHLKSTPQTKNIIDEKKIKLMNGKYLINTSRGDLIDENSLYDSLKSYKIRAAGLDVYRNEPTTGISLKIQMLPNVIATCHTASYDNHSINQAATKSIANIINHFNGNFSKVDKYVN